MNYLSDEDAKRINEKINEKNQENVRRNNRIDEIKRNLNNAKNIFLDIVSEIPEFSKKIGLKPTTIVYQKCGVFNVFKRKDKFLNAYQVLGDIYYTPDRKFFIYYLDSLMESYSIQHIKPDEIFEISKIFIDSDDCISLIDCNYRTKLLFHCTYSARKVDDDFYKDERLLTKEQIISSFKHSIYGI